MKNIFMVLLICSFLLLIGCKSVEKNSSETSIQSVAEPDENTDDVFAQTDPEGSRKNRPREEVDAIISQIKEDNLNTVAVIYDRNSAIFYMIYALDKVNELFAKENFRESTFYKSTTDYIDSLTAQLELDYNFPYGVALLSSADDRLIYVSVKGQGFDVYPED